MSAALLREAADRLDALIEPATPGPWGPAVVDGMGFAVHRGEHDTVAPYADRYDAAYIAAMSPTVGKALAAWLRGAAEEHAEDACYRFLPPNGCYEARRALVVARAVLGRDT